MVPEGSGLRSRLPGCRAAGRRRFLKTREKPTGEVRPPPRARNQVREPRRRQHAPARAGAPAQDTRGKGTRSRSGKGETMTATDPPPTGGAAARRRMTAPLPGTRTRPRSEAGRRFTPPAGVIPDGAERLSGTSGGLVPAARGHGPPLLRLRGTAGVGGHLSARQASAALRPQAGKKVRAWTASCPNRLQHMNSGHADHDIA